MRCLSPAQVEEIFTQPRFAVSLEHEGYRSALYLEPSLASQQVRIAAEQPKDVAALDHFIRTLNRWLPSNRRGCFGWTTGRPAFMAAKRTRWSPPLGAASGKHAR